MFSWERRRRWGSWSLTASGTRLLKTSVVLCKGSCYTCGAPRSHLRIRAQDSVTSALWVTACQVGHGGSTCMWLACSKRKVNRVCWDLGESSGYLESVVGLKMCEESVTILLEPSDVEWSKLLSGSLTLNDSPVRWGGLLDQAVNALAKEIPDQYRKFNESPC